VGWGSGEARGLCLNKGRCLLRVHHIYTLLRERRSKVIENIKEVP
jgi:hypothetical protein